jgi:hypothetical protein
MIDPSQHLPEGATSWLDAGAMLVFVLHILGLALPHILTAFTIIWLGTRIVESPSTVKLWRWVRRKPQD